METKTKKEELLQWLEKVEDAEVLYQIETIKNREKKKAAFDFDKEWENGYTVEEAKLEMRKRIKSYPWKK